jgi:hypothetical protein
MRIGANASWQDVLNASPQLVEILRKEPPPGTEWKWANVEQCDTDRVFLLRYSFDKVSYCTRRLADGARYFAEHYQDGVWIPGTHDEHYVKKLTNIMNTVDVRQGVLVMVADNETGPFTLLDANHRAIYFMHRQTIVGRQALLGTNTAMRNYCWHFVPSVPRP